jgi:hypothetical protein
MSKNVLREVTFPEQMLQKSKPRYTEAENQLIFDSWWNPEKRRELAEKLGRDMSALRSQFSRLLKERGMSNREYYHTKSVQSAHDNGAPLSKRSRELKTTDQVIFDTFCKHQALGNPRTKACEELIQKLGDTYTVAALKLRFYRMVNKFKYRDEDLLKIGKKLLAETSGISEPEEAPELSAPLDTLCTISETGIIPVTESKLSVTNPADHGPVQLTDDGTSFFYQISSLPETIRNLEERLARLEEQQRRQLDLRGFIEHLLAVERDIKREDKLVEEIQRLMDDNEAIRRMMEKEKDRLKKREDELSEVYQILNTLLSDFMRLESVSKLASLGDFMHRLEITVDQFGNVMRSRRVS